MQHKKLSSLSHDLHNYIGAINGLANIITESINTYKTQLQNKGKDLNDDLKELCEYVDLLTPYSQEAMHYVEDMLDTMSSDSQKLHLENCNITKLMERLLILNKGFIIENKVIIQTVLSQDLPEIHTDVKKLKRILNNILTNAIKYTPTDNIIEINVQRKSAKKIKITIADNGIGMTQEELKMAFNGQSAQIDKSSLNKPFKSHGLGLDITKQLCDATATNITISSTKGKGTKVTLLLQDLAN